jgi:citrate lyase subunit beta/citryl-CoA lyase
MENTARPRRSLLYMPGSNARALEKGRSLPADGIIFDLEDAVAPGAKAAARDQVVAALGEGGYGGRELLVRINGLDTAWAQDDIAAIAPAQADGILLPKVESAETVQLAEDRLAGYGARPEMAIWCMIETPLGVLRAEEIAGATPRLGGLVMGTNDLAKELHCRQTPDRLPFMTSFGLCILAARAHRIAIIDGVYPDLSDEEGFAASCLQGRALGFDGKSLIHPKTIAAANEFFGPAPDEIAWARKIAEAFEAARSEDKAVIVVDGQLVEDLHVAEARRLVAMAERIAAIEEQAEAKC